MLHVAFFPRELPLAAVPRWPGQPHSLQPAPRGAEVPAAARRQIRRELLSAIGRAMVGVLLSLLIAGCDGADPKPVQMKDEPLEKLLPINTRPRVLAIGSGFSVGIKSDGSVWSWGTSPVNGSLGRKVSKQEDGWLPARIPNMDSAKSVVAGHVGVILMRDGTVWTWGPARYGLGYQVGGQSQLEPKRVPGVSNVVDVSIWGSAVHALLEDGTVVGWGGGRSGVLGPAKLGENEWPSPISGLVDIVRSVPGFSIDKHGVLWTYGTCVAALGRETAGDGGACLTPAPVVLPGRVVDVASGVDAAYALLSDGTVWSWGTNNGGKLGIPGIASTVLPKRVPGLSRVVLLASNSAGAAAVTDSGMVVTWGVSALAPPPPAPFSRKDLHSPHVVGVLDNPPATHLVGGFAAYAVVDALGIARYWISNAEGQRGTGEIVRKPDERYWRTLEVSKWSYR